tara:strand:+ start:458 stop:736 length:279 start_codon:yes stop_codon:yes gene_type:complete
MSKQKQFGRDWTNGEVNFPKHLTPKIIHSALFIYNASSAEETKQRVDHCVKEIGDEAISFAMAILMLPTLMNSMAQSDEYKDWQQSRIKTLN